MAQPETSQPDPTLITADDVADGDRQPAGAAGACGSRRNS